MHIITNEEIEFCDKYTTKLCKRCGRLPDDDAIQSGRLGMVEASHTYEPEKSESFIGWATYLIKHFVYREHFGMGKKDALHNSKKSVAEFTDFRYSMPSHEKEVITKDLFDKTLKQATIQQRSVVREMYLHDKNAYEMEEEFGKTHQSYDRLYQHAKKRMNTKKMRREIAR